MNTFLFLGGGLKASYRFGRFYVRISHKITKVQKCDIVIILSTLWL